MRARLRPLFSDTLIFDVWRRRQEILVNDIDTWEDDRILNMSITDAFDYLSKKHKMHPPMIVNEKIHINEERTANINGYVAVVVPISGDINMLKIRPTKYSSVCPRAETNGSSITLLVHVGGYGADAKVLVEREINNLKNYLEWLSNDCNEWNSQLEGKIDSRLRRKKDEIMKRRELLDSIGLPIRKRNDVPEFANIPVTRKRVPVQSVPAGGEKYVTEPTLDESIFEQILSIVMCLSLCVERNPTAFSGMKEEWIRDIILVILNSHFEMDATGETFNSGGKTDIYIPFNGKRVFVAECKIWRGLSACRKSIDQLLNNLTWRDTKSALIIFSKNKDFGGVIQQAIQAIEGHKNFKRELERAGETYFRYVFRQERDSNRETHLAVLLFDVSGTNEKNAS